MEFRNSAMPKSGGKAGMKRMAAASAAPKRMATAKKSAPPKKTAPAKKPPAKKPAAAGKKAATAKKPEAVKKAAQPAKTPATAAKPAPATAPRLATPVASNGHGAAKPSAPSGKAAPSAAARSGAPSGPASAEERRKAITRKFFARLRSLEAIVGADLRKRGSLVLMQAVDQWYSEAISANATDVSITNAAKAVIAQL
jgi:hypothetical protein